MLSFHYSKKKIVLQETSIDSVPDDVPPPHPVDEPLDDLAEEGDEEPEPEIPEAISPEKSPREGATSAAPPETATSKLRFDDFLNLMEVF